MPGPFLSYLRVYEPLRVFAGPSGAAVRAALARGPIAPERAGHRERDLCLRAQVGKRLLPGDAVGSRPTGEASVDVLVLGAGSGEPLVCPLDTRPRAAAAVLSFLAEEDPVLCASALPVPPATARRRAEAALAELGDAAAHVVTATWTVPLPWFALVDPDDRELRLGRRRRVSWRIPIGTARARAARAERIVRAALGQVGPTEVLAETDRWLERFDRASMVELDYGGLVDLFDEAALRTDTSAGEVARALRALGEGDTETAAACYDRLREFWGVVAGKQRAG
ncbi:hypothetical protein ACVGVM_01705 [Pseudonocardia bannensis]|uniref:DUF8083 domain-containing protein n=1 Tax=Pseudonocardia bannensis TaxID=630973 RepID=A0A848DDQ6_9PSEU|nr:hypothetical protein [Pseudonocardia bannensis]NMH90705.1 hypothetical protein [Pseudonocardia bannensis]